MGYLSPDIPAAPDPNVGYREGVLTDLQLLPDTKKIEWAASTGNKITLSNGKTYDFTGLGDTAYQKEYGDQMSKLALEIQRDIGPQYIEQRAKELEAADPEGVKARKALYDAIQADINKTPDTQNAAELQRQILEDVKAGGALSDYERNQIEQGSLGQQVARGNYLGAAPTLDRARAVASATDAKRSATQQRALQFLVSGATPEDVTYRNNLQGESNLGAYLSGSTPLAQFGQLSGAQQQAAPVITGGFGVGTNANAGTQGMAYQQQGWNAQVGAALNQVNPWVSGISFGLQGAGLAAAGIGATSGGGKTGVTTGKG